jgi:hypothetical protein
VRLQREQPDRGLGRVVGVDAERVGELLSDGAERGVDVELHRPAEEVVGIQVAEDDVAVGHRQRLVAAPEAHRAGVRAGPSGPIWIFFVTGSSRM